MLWLDRLLNRKRSRPLVLQERDFESHDLAYDAFLLLLNHVEKGPIDKYNSRIKSLPLNWRAVYTTFWLECEVNNGGHHQFFWNSDGAFNQETLEDLEYIGANEYAEVYSIALNIYKTHDYPTEKKAANFDWEKFTVGYNEKRLDECDNRFYELNQKQTVADLLAAFILENKPLFMNPNVKT